MSGNNLYNCNIFKNPKKTKITSSERGSRTLPPEAEVLVPNSRSLWVSAYSMIPKISSMGDSTILWEVEGGQVKLSTRTLTDYKVLWLEPRPQLYPLMIGGGEGCLTEQAAQSCYLLHVAHVGEVQKLVLTPKLTERTKDWNWPCELGGGSSQLIKNLLFVDLFTAKQTLCECFKSFREKILAPVYSTKLWNSLLCELSYGSSCYLMTWMTWNIQNN